MLKYRWMFDEISSPEEGYYNWNVQRNIKNRFIKFWIVLFHLLFFMYVCMYVCMYVYL